MKTFSEKLKESRSLAGMSQEDLAQRIEVSRRSVLSYEKGEKFPRDRVLYKIASVLGVSVKYLKDDSCTDPEADISLDSRISEIAERYGANTAKDTETIINESCAFLAGGDVPMEEKEAFFNAVMSAYVKCREQSREKYGRKK